MDNNVSFLDNKVITEFLCISVKPELTEKFIELDKKIWNNMLSKYDGFIKKEIWQNKNDESKIFSIIYWESHEKMTAISQEDIIATCKKFDSIFGEKNYNIEVIDRVYLFKK